MYFQHREPQGVLIDKVRVPAAVSDDDMHHGKGEGRERPAILKSCVNHWLRQFEQVLAFHTAQKYHGGLGATYVLIKKGSVARQNTSEKLDRAGRSNS